MNSALTDAGKYVCDVTGGCGKVVSTEATVTVTPTTSVAGEDSDIHAWLRIIGPIPSDDYVILQTNLDQPVNASARIFDDQGRVVAVARLGVLSQGESRVRLSLTQCVSGLHSVEVEAGANVARFTVMVKR